MADNTAKIILDASADGVLRAADAVKKKFVEVGEQGGKAGEKMVGQLGKALIGAAAVAAAVRGIAEAYNKAAESAAKLSVATGGRQVKAELSGQKAGLTAQQTQAFMNSRSSLSADEKTTALAAVAAMTGPGDKKIDPQSASRALALINTGVMDAGRVSSAFKKGGKRGLTKLFGEANQIKDGLSDRAREELSMQEEENAAALRVDETTSDFGSRTRLANARKAALAAENPWAYGASDAIKGGIGKVPLIGPSAEAGINAATDFIYQRQMADDLKQIRVDSRPRLNASANGPGN